MKISRSPPPKSSLPIEREKNWEINDFRRKFLGKEKEGGKSKCPNNFLKKKVETPKKGFGRFWDEIGQKWKGKSLKCKKARESAFPTEFRKKNAEIKC